MILSRIILMLGVILVAGESLAGLCDQIGCDEAFNRAHEIHFETSAVLTDLEKNSLDTLVQTENEKFELSLNQKKYSITRDLPKIRFEKVTSLLDVAIIPSGIDDVQSLLNRVYSQERYGCRLDDQSWACLAPVLEFPYTETDPHGKVIGIPRLVRVRVAKTRFRWLVGSTAKVKTRFQWAPPRHGIFRPVTHHRSKIVHRSRVDEEIVISTFLRIQLMNKVSGLPMMGVEVSLSSGQAVLTNERGKAHFEKLSPGEYQVTVRSTETGRIWRQQNIRLLSRMGRWIQIELDPETN